MKDYIVYNTEEPSYNRVFLVKTNNKKEAIDKVYKFYGSYDGYRKKDYKAYSVEECYANSDIQENIVDII